MLTFDLDVPISILLVKSATKTSEDLINTKSST